MNPARLLFGVACAYLAYVTQKHGETFFMSVAALLAGGVAFEVFKNLARSATKPTPGQREDQSLIANIVFCSGAMALALRYSVILIPIIVDECNRAGGNATPSATALYAAWGGVGFCLPFVAAFSGRNVAARLQGIFDPGVADRPIYQLGRPLLGFALFVLTVYLLAKGIATAQAQVVPNGWSCRI